MADYCTFQEIKDAIPDSPMAQVALAEYSTAFGAMITAASRLIDKEVGRWANFFYPSTDAETRYFDGSADIHQWIDEAVSVSQLSVAESGDTDFTDWTVDTDYFVWPYNYTQYGQPIMRIDINRNGDKGKFPRFRRAVKIVGVFGYSATPPADIKEACKIQTVRWYMRAKQGYQDTSAAADMGQMVFQLAGKMRQAAYGQNLDADIRELLKAYQIGNTV